MPAHAQSDQAMQIIKQSPHFVLVCGGIRSGKSQVAEAMATRHKLPVYYLATLIADKTDRQLLTRIKKHRQRRPPDWPVIEEPLRPHDTIDNLNPGPALVLIDCISMLVSNLLLKNRRNKHIKSVQPESAANAVQAIIQKLTAAINKRNDLSFIAVTGEVGMGVIPGTRMGRVYADLLGQTNQHLAQKADEVWLVSCGLKHRLKP